MAKKSVYVCDVCGTPKGEGNKWICGFIVDADLKVCSLASIGFMLTQWTPGLAQRNGVHHFCSEKCALTKQNEYIR